MSPSNAVLPAADSEISALIATLHATGQRLQQLTAGEVDTVADQYGHTFVLREAQVHLRHHEAAKQASILNALPANIALIDTRGVIVSVNQAWKDFSSGSAASAPGAGVGSNYLEICDHAEGSGATEALRAACARCWMALKRAFPSSTRATHRPGDAGS